MNSFASLDYVMSVLVIEKRPCANLPCVPTSPGLPISITNAREIVRFHAETTFNLDTSINGTPLHILRDRTGQHRTKARKTFETMTTLRTVLFWKQYFFSFFFSNTKLNCKRSRYCLQNYLHVQIYMRIYTRTHTQAHSRMRHAHMHARTHVCKGMGK